jgi:hypothetical protein
VQLQNSAFKILYLASIVVATIGWLFLIVACLKRVF